MERLELRGDQWDRSRIFCAAVRRHVGSTASGNRLFVEAMCMVPDRRAAAPPAGPLRQIEAPRLCRRPIEYMLIDAAIVRVHRKASVPTRKAARRPSVNCVRDAPMQFGGDQIVERNVIRQGREPVIGRSLLAFGPLDQLPFFVRLAGLFVAGSEMNRIGAKGDSHSLVPSRHLMVRRGSPGSQRRGL